MCNTQYDRSHHTLCAFHNISTIIGTAVVFLALTRIPREERWMKISRARWILFATFVILAVSGYFKVSDEDPELLSLTTLCVASYQALLFTYTASVLISPAGVSRIRFTTVFVVITFMVILLAAFKVFLPVAFRVVWALAVVACCILLGIHTIMFRELSLVAKNISKTFTTKMWTITCARSRHCSTAHSQLSKLFGSSMGLGISFSCCCILSVALFTESRFSPILFFGQYLISRYPEMLSILKFSS